MFLATGYLHELPLADNVHRKGPTRSIGRLAG
jgi:hypothetical protein